MKKNNTTKKDRSELKKNIVLNSQKGLGIFVFKNRSNEATLQLPKTSLDGKKWVGPNQTWQGDSFFLKMIPKEAVLVETIESPDEQKQKEKKMNEEKLILDQPDQITTEGKVEHVATSTELVDLNEEENNKKKRKTKNENSSSKSKLLTEDPIAGVTIIRD